MSVTGVTLPVNDVAARSHDALADDRAFLRIPAALVVAIDVFVPAAIGRIEALPQRADIEAAVVFSRAAEFLHERKVRPGQDSRCRRCDKKKPPHGRTSSASSPKWSGTHITKAGTLVTLAANREIGEGDRPQPAADQKSVAFACGIGYSFRLVKYFSKASLFSAQIDSSCRRLTRCQRTVPDQG